MDFVIFGMGLGATLVVLGWFWRVLGPRLRHRPASGELLSGEQMVHRISWARFCRSGGAVGVLGGCLLLFAALASLLLHLSDRTGALVGLAAFGVVALGVIVWLWAYLRRFGLTGLVAPHAPKPAPAPAVATTRLVRRPATEPQPQPAMTPAAPVLGPAVPADVAAMTATDAAAPPDQALGTSEETTSAESGPPPQGEVPAAMAPADDPSADAGEKDAGEVAPTVIGAAGRDQDTVVEAGATAEVSADAGSEPPSAREDDVAPATLESAAPGARPAETVTAPARPAPAADPSPGGDDASSAGAAATGRAQPARADRPAATTSDNGTPRVRREALGSPAFREAVARQDAHLAHAAGDRSVAAPPQPRRFPAPRGAEGVQWVRGDASSAVPAGFPVKGDPATRLFYPASSELYQQATARYYFASVRDAEAAGYRLAPAPRRLTTDRPRPQARPAAPATHPGQEGEVGVPAGLEGRDWVHADGTDAVPAGFPVKGNASSKLYHPVGTRFYDRTIAEYYFASPQAAEAAGYQLPPSLRHDAEAAAHQQAREVARQPADHELR